MPRCVCVSVCVCERVFVDFHLPHSQPRIQATCQQASQLLAVICPFILSAFVCPKVTFNQANQLRQPPAARRADQLPGKGHILFFPVAFEVN